MSNDPKDGGIAAVLHRAARLAQSAPTLRR